MNKTMIDALLMEREGYARLGLTHRVAEVDEQLRLYGHSVAVKESAAVEPRVEYATAPKARKRKTDGDH